MDEDEAAYDVSEALRTIEEILGPRPKNEPGPYSDSITDRRLYYLRLMDNYESDVTEAKRKVSVALIDLEVATINRCSAMAALQIIEAEMQEDE